MSSIVLGAREGTNFVIHENANNKLLEIVEMLERDEMGQYRMSLVNDRVLHEQIIPCLIAAKDSNIIPITTVRLLLFMTDPLSGMYANQPIGVKEIYQSYLSNIKESINDPLVTWAILKLMRFLATLNPSPADNNGAILKDCLSLLTNLFSIPEFQPSSTAAAVIAHLQRPSRQNGLIWNLLYQSFDAILLDLIHKRQWSEPVVGIIRLMFKDTKTEVMQKQIKEWMDNASNSSSDYTYPRSSDENEIFSSSGSDSKKSKSHPTQSVSPQAGSSGETQEPDLGNRIKIDVEFPKSSQRANNNSSSSMSDHSTKERENKRKVQDILANLTSGYEPSQKKIRKHSPDRSEQKKKLLSRGERRKYQKDGFSSGITGSENGSSDSESEEEQWRVGVKAGDFSDPGYYSYQNQLANVKRTLEETSEIRNRDRRKRIIEVRSKTKKLKSRTLATWTVATEEDMLEVLREFAVDFLLKGYSALLSDIHQQLLTIDSLQLIKYKQNYAWLIYYFLPLASQMEISIQKIPLTYEVLHYLTGETIFCILKILSTSIDVCLGEFEVIKEFVKAQRQFFETLKEYEKTEMTKEDCAIHKNVFRQVVSTKNIRQLFVLLLRFTSLCGKPSLEYLSNLIVGNHIYLTTIQETLSNPSDVEFDMSCHIKQFSFKEMMRPYGQLLEKFRENSVQENDCIFTMMHHVAGDLTCPQALDVCPIPETLLQLSVTEMQVCDDWKDLIEYMMNYFRFRKREFKGNSKSSVSSSSSRNDKGTQTYSIKSDCSKSEKPSSGGIKKSSSSSEKKATSSENPRASISEVNNSKSPTNIQVKDGNKSDKHSNGKDKKSEESKNGKSKAGNGVKNETGNEADDDENGSPFELVNDGEADNPRNNVAGPSNPGNYVAGPSNPANYVENSSNTGNYVAGPSNPGNYVGNPSNPASESSSMIAFPSPSNTPGISTSPETSPGSEKRKKEVIRSLVEILRRDCQETAIHWLQESLLDAWKVQRTIENGTSTMATFYDQSYDNKHPLEALPSYHILRGKDIPLVAWSKEHANSLKNKVFLQLLSQMGLHVGDSPNRTFPSIPRSWSANDLLEHALDLGLPASEKYATTLVLHGIMPPGQII